MKNIIFSSVGKKFLVGITGIFVCCFALVHIGGNSLLFIGEKAFNLYSYKLTHNHWFLYPVEIILSLIFILHFTLTFWLAFENTKVKPSLPKLFVPGEKNVSIGSQTMVYTGSLVLIFLILHVIAFRFGTYYETSYDGLVVRDLYRLVVEKFQDPLFVSWYVLCLIVLGIHLSHGVASIFQSLGIMPSNAKWPKRIAYGFIIIVIGGFISQPIFFYFFGGIS